MEKVPRIRHSQETTERAEHVIGWLGLSFDDLKDKISLDAGAGSGAVSSEGEKRGCTIIAIDRSPIFGMHDAVLDDIPYAIADALRLPFKDETFDYVLSHAAPPTTWTDTPELVARTLEEYYRVLKPGGEIRFGNGLGTLSGGAVDKMMTWREKIFSRAIPVVGKNIDQRIREKHSLDFLKTLHPEIVRSTPKNNVSNTQAYFVIHKPSKIDSASADENTSKK